MSISKNVGGLSKFLKHVRLSHSYETVSKNYKTFLSKTRLGKKFLIFHITLKKDLSVALMIIFLLI